jgi:rRNA maturation protein Nop10
VLHDEFSCWWCGEEIVIEAPGRPLPAHWKVVCPHCGTVNDYRPPPGYDLGANDAAGKLLN